MSEEESVSQLRMLGLNVYESKAYLALLKGRELTAKGVGLAALIPQSRTYDILESLSRKGFALETPGSPSTYVPVDPAKILGSHYAAEKKKIQQTAVQAQEDAQAKLDRLQEAYSSLTGNFPTGGGEQRAVRDRVWVLQSRENIEDALIELIKQSKTAVLRITKPPELSTGEPLDPFYIVGMENRRYLYDALDRKVKMRWLSLAREIPTFSGLDVVEPPERRYVENERDITEKFLLVDNHSVLLNLHDPVTSTYGSVALAMESRAAASIFQDHFERVWESGKALDRILPQMKQLVIDVSLKLGELGFPKVDVLTYRTLARLGAVSRETVVAELAKKKVQPQESATSMDRLMRLRLIQRDSTYRLLVVEHPSVVWNAANSGDLSPKARRVTTRKSPSGKNS